MKISYDTEGVRRSYTTHSKAQDIRNSHREYLQNDKNTTFSNYYLLKKSTTGFMVSLSA